MTMRVQRIQRKMDSCFKYFRVLLFETWEEHCTDRMPLRTAECSHASKGLSRVYKTEKRETISRSNSSGRALVIPNLVLATTSQTDLDEQPRLRQARYIYHRPNPSFTINRCYRVLVSQERRQHSVEVLETGAPVLGRWRAI